MEQLLSYGLAGVVLIAVAWISIRTAMNEAKMAGESKAKEEASEAARKAEQEMADAGNKEPSPEETRDKLNRGTF